MFQHSVVCVSISIIPLMIYHYINVKNVSLQLGIFVLVCVILAGAWFGYWGVRKLVLAEDESVGEGVAYFVEWAILIISAVMILQVLLL